MDRVGANLNLDLNANVVAALAVVALVAFVQLGVRAAVSALSVAGLLLLCYQTYADKEARIAAESAKMGLSAVVPDASQGEGAPPTNRMLLAAVIPQDATFQVPVNVDDHDKKKEPQYREIPQYPAILAALKPLGDAKRRRPAAMRLCLAELERFLVLYRWLGKRRVPPLGNSRIHATASQKLDDMALLRTELLQQLVELGMEFPGRNADLERAVVGLRDYTHELMVKAVARWRSALPGCSAMPPFGVVPQLAASGQHAMRQSLYR